MNESCHCSNRSTDLAASCSAPKAGVENPAVIDQIVHDSQSDIVTLTMIETRPWDGSEFQLFQLQEKLNAYMSFALDGEMAESYPALVNKPVRIRLDCAEPPDEGADRLLRMVRDQIAFQNIALEVRVVAPR